MSVSTLALRVLGLALLLATGSGALAADLAITDARVHTVTGAGVVEGATILVDEGRIVAVGRSVEIPAGTRRIDAAGRDVTPGLFEGYGNMGLTELGLEDSTEDDQVEGVARGAGFSIRHAVNPYSAQMGVARAGGVTRAMVAPVSANHVFAGMGSVIGLAPGEDVVTHADRALFATLGIRGGRHAGGSRSAALQELDQAFAEAAVYSASSALSQGAQASMLSLPRHDLEALEAFAASGRRLGVVAHRSTDILQAVKLMGARDIPLVVIGGSEAWQVAAALAAADVPVILDPLDNLPSNYDQLGARLDTATLLHEAGVKVAFASGEGPHARRIRQFAGNAVAEGLPQDVAMAAITHTPAEIWGLGNRFGRVERGYVADLVIWNGDPLETTTWAEVLVIDGVETAMDSRQRRLEQRYARPEDDTTPIWLK